MPVPSTSPIVTPNLPSYPSTHKTTTKIPPLASPPLLPRAQLRSTHTYSHATHARQCSAPLTHRFAYARVEPKAFFWGGGGALGRYCCAFLFTLYYLGVLGCFAGLRVCINWPERLPGVSGSAHASFPALAHR